MLESTEILAENDVDTIYINEDSASYVPLPEVEPIEAVKLATSIVDSNTYHNLEIGDIKIIRCNNPSCPTTIAKDEAEKIWNRFYDVGLVGKTSKNRYYLVDPSKEVLKKKPVFKDLWGEWININKLLNDVYKSKKDFRPVSRQQWAQDIAKMKNGAHNLLNLFKKHMLNSHPGYADEVYSPNSIFEGRENNYRSHDDKDYDYRGGDTSLVCPQCGCDDIITVGNKDKLKHECAVTGGDCEDTYLVQHGDFQYLFSPPVTEYEKEQDKKHWHETLCNPVKYEPKTITTCTIATRNKNGTKILHEGRKIACPSTVNEYMDAWEQREKERREFSRELFIEALKTNTDVDAYIKVTLNTANNNASDDVEWM